MSFLKNLLFFAIFFLLYGAPAQAAYHKDYDGLLESYVRPSSSDDIRYFGVDYDGWAKDPRHHKVMKALSETDLEKLETRNKKLAFWINAYNLMVIDLIITTGERENIRNQASRLKTPWNSHSWEIDGVKHTLDHILNKIIRPMGDPRAHFALTGGSKSSPDLRPRAYRAHQLDDQLDDQVMTTLTNDTKGLKFESGNVVRLHRHFKRHENDFADGNVRSWLQNYYPDKINRDTTLGYFTFNKSLNRIE